MIWLGPDQLEQLGVSRGILVRNRDAWTWRETGRRGRNGKPIRECQLESMGQTWIQKWLAQQPSLDRSLTTDIETSPVRIMEPEVSETLDAETGQKAGAEDRLTEALKRYDLNVREAFLAEAQRLASIIERYDAVEPKRRRDSNGKFVFVSKIVELCEHARCNDPVILAIEPGRSKPRSPHTLDAWSKQFRIDGLATFLRKPTESTGKPDKRKAEISAAAVEWINANWRKTPSAERLFKGCQKQARKHGWTIPARGWFYRKYQSIDQVTRTLVFEGQKSYTGKFAPFVPRDVRDLAALQVLVGDHSVRDVTVMLPDGSLTRPWLTIWQDMRTGLIWGWHLDLVPSSTTIGLAYANGVQNFGAQPIANPETGFQSYLYTDQGKDYRCKQLAGQTIEFRDENYGKAAKIGMSLEALCTQRRVGLIDELGLKHILARGYNAREKFVERTHKDISAWEQSTFENEYCGRGVGHKPERWKDSWARHQKLIKRAGKNTDWILNESPFMTLDDYRDNLAGWITEYNSTEHTRSVLAGATVVPVREYERLYTTRYEISEDALTMLLMRVAKRKIGKNGIQFFQPHWYFLNEEMGRFKGCEVEVRYTDQDYSRVWVVLPDKRTVEAEMVGRSGVLNPNKQTMSVVAKQIAHEKKIAREYQLVSQSNWRGETVEDRVNAMLGHEEEPEPIEQKMAVNARPTVHAFNRFERLESGISRSEVTADDVARANVIPGMFGADRPETKRIKDEWED